MWMRVEAGRLRRLRHRRWTTRIDCVPTDRTRFRLANRDKCGHPGRPAENPADSFTKCVNNSLDYLGSSACGTGEKPCDRHGGKNATDRGSRAQGVDERHTGPQMFSDLKSEERGDDRHAQRWNAQRPIEPQAASLTNGEKGYANGGDGPRHGPQHTEVTVGYERLVCQTGRAGYPVTDLMGQKHSCHTKQGARKCAVAEHLPSIEPRRRQLPVRPEKAQFPAPASYVLAQRVVELAAELGNLLVATVRLGVE